MAVFIHGFLGTNAMWKDVVAPEDKCFALSGHDTDHQPENLIDSNINDFNGVIDWFANIQAIEKLGEPSTFIGYSMGARVALALAIKYPRLVKGLALIGCNPGIVETGERQKRMLWEDELCKVIKEDGMDAFVKLWEQLPLFHSQKSLSDKLRLQQQKDRLKHTPGQIIKVLNTMGTGSMDSMWDQLTLLSIPIIHMAGELDSKFVKLSTKANSITPNSKLEIIKGVGHNVILESGKSGKKIISNAIKWIENNPIK